MSNTSTSMAGPNSNVKQHTSTPHERARRNAMSNQLKPLTEPYSSEVDELLKVYPRQDGYLLALFRTFANSPRFLKKGVANFLDKESPLTLRQRELVILRTTANYRCEYEWGVHAAIFAKAAKLDEASLFAITTPDVNEAIWSPEEARLLIMIDEFCACGSLSDETRQRFEEDWSLEQQLEIIAIVGAYHTVSMVANVADLQLESFALPLPSHLESGG